MGQSYSILPIGLGKQIETSYGYEKMYGYILPYDAIDTSDGIQIHYGHGYRELLLLLQDNPNYEKIKKSLQKGKLILVEVYYGIYSGYILNNILDIPIYTATIIYGKGVLNTDDISYYGTPNGYYRIHPPSCLSIHKTPEHEILETSRFFMKNIDNMISDKKYNIKYVRDLRQTKFHYVKDLSEVLCMNNECYRVTDVELAKCKTN